MSPLRALPTLNHRLDSWKQIAGFFDRDERTVKRWEKERALPVHRLPGGSRARVFAFTDELRQWMHSQESGPARDSSPGVVPKEAGQPIEPASVAWNRRASDHPQSGRTGRQWFVVAACGMLAALAITALVVAHHVQAASLARKNALAAKAVMAPAVNPEAQELYLKGRYYWNKRTPADLTKAVDYFTQAIVRDPSFAQPYVGLADCYNLLREFSAMPAQEAYPRALAAAKKAVELDDNSAEAHASLAFVTFYWNWDAAGAEREFRRAIDLNPDYATAHHWYATFLMAVGRLPEALAEIDRAQQLDPSSTPILCDKALILYQVGRSAEATALLKQIEASQPGFISTHRYLAVIYLDQGDWNNYLTEARKAALLAQDERQLAIVQAAEQGFKAGGKQEMLESTLETQKKYYDDGEISAFSVAVTAAQLGRQQEALQYLQASYQRHDPLFTSILTEESLQRLHGDPAFRKLVAQAGLPPLPR